MIIKQLQNNLKRYREYGDLQRVRVLASVVGEMEDRARRQSRDRNYGNLLIDDDANTILKRRIKHAGITLTQNPDDPTAKLMIEVLSPYITSDVMSDEELTRRILESDQQDPKKILRHLKEHFGIAVDQQRAREVVRGIFG